MPKGEAVAILVPSRTLRDDHALNADYGVGNALDTALGKDKSGTRAAPPKANMCTRVMWLGRPADDNTSTMWDGQVFKLTQEALAEPLAELKEPWPVKRSLKHTEHDLEGRPQGRRG